MIIGITGYKGSGKSTFSKIFSDIAFKDTWLGATEKTFAFDLRFFCLNLLGDATLSQIHELEKPENKVKPVAEVIKVNQTSAYNRVALRSAELIYDYCDEQITKEQIAKLYNTLYNPVTNRFREELTVRQMLQLIGTEWGRHYWPNIWLDKARNSILEAFEARFKPDYVIVSDVRFPNEAELILSMGGIVVEVQREGLISSDVHLSEQRLPEHLITRTIHNDGTDNFKEQVRLFYQELKTNKQEK